VKCSICGQPAILNLRHHMLKLCALHLVEWFPEQVARSIKRYRMFGPQDRVLVAVSGGKDSLSLWDVLLRLGYKADGMYINLGIEERSCHSEGSHGLSQPGDYSEKSLERVRVFADQRPGVRYQVVDVAAEYGLNVPDLARRNHRSAKMCSLCGLVKRHLMNRAAYQGGYAAIATGHNLDDEVATLLQNTLHWETGYLARQAPVLPSTHPRLVRKVKPLARMYERDSAAYALVQGIDYIYDECPYAEGAKSIFFKKLFNQIENLSTGTKSQFYLQFLKAKQRGRIAFPQLEAKEEDEAPRALLHDCDKCGQPTSSADLCAFCRLWEKT